MVTGQVALPTIDAKSGAKKLTLIGKIFMREMDRKNCKLSSK
jgi:hypothetical protein